MEDFIVANPGAFCIVCHAVRFAVSSSWVLAGSGTYCCHRPSNQPLRHLSRPPLAERDYEAFIRHHFPLADVSEEEEEEQQAVAATGDPQQRRRQRQGQKAAQQQQEEEPGQQQQRQQEGEEPPAAAASGRGRA